MRNDRNNNESMKSYKEVPDAMKLSINEGRKIRATSIFYKNFHMKLQSNDYMKPYTMPCCLLTNFKNTRKYLSRDATITIPFIFGVTH